MLALFAITFVGAVVWGARAAGIAKWPDPVMARRRVEEASGLPHRPLEALADRPVAHLVVVLRAHYEAARVGALELCCDVGH